jgi:hypothetical protein
MYTQKEKLLMYIDKEIVGGYILIFSEEVVNDSNEPLGQRGNKKFINYTQEQLKQVITDNYDDELYGKLPSDAHKVRVRGWRSESIE